MGEVPSWKHLETKMKKAINIFLLTAAFLVVSAAGAETVEFEAVMSPKEQFKLDFEDGSKHFVLFVRREGNSEGTGPLAGAKVTEYGMHDVIPGVSGDPHGYLVFETAAGDKVYLKWAVRAVFLPAEGKPVLADYGYWDIVGATGSLSGLKGVGWMQIKAVNKTDRLFTFSGDVAR